MIEIHGGVIQMNITLSENTKQRGLNELKTCPVCNYVANVSWESCAVCGCELEIIIEPRRPALADGWVGPLVDARFRIGRDCTMLSTLRYLER
jgi:hypothetical protein